MDDFYVVLSAKEKGDDEGRTIPPLSEGKKKKGAGSDNDGDDIHKISPSLTFLCMISKKHNSVDWLELGTVTEKDHAPIAGGSFSSQTNFTAVAMSMSLQQQSAAAAWQAHCHNYMNQTMAMQSKKTKEIQPQTTNKKRKRVSNYTQKSDNALDDAQQKQMSEEAKAAIANANLQARTELNAQFMRQQFVNSQLQMQQMMQMQMMPQMFQARQWHQQQDEVDNQSQ
eukprot:CAMPEP_0172315342 /NCGR_PEP_ID=MMETSP1058-20130122/24917_1 /TAXON_ID=83371 /ORGANISM="Detonula confervacea, Strain CCMP 353" /LENGTH=225 /DNA_ID=CAMNT_0013029409 /DNA_START=574 /DNA_END=1249 /DNA_ORIENTATION=-